MLDESKFTKYFVNDIGENGDEEITHLRPYECNVYQHVVQYVEQSL